MFGNVNWYFLLTHYSKIEITDLKPFLAGENTSVQIILAINWQTDLHQVNIKVKNKSHTILLYNRVGGNALQVMQLLNQITFLK